MFETGLNRFGVSQIALFDRSGDLDRIDVEDVVDRVDAADEMADEMADDDEVDGFS